ncbi:MAG: transporter substrate-binding domain-containing protein [Desulfobacula sp.]|nr:transporter substrate-binding domain-containing protein [Desulfobacula sp.]
MKNRIVFMIFIILFIFSDLHAQNVKITSINIATPYWENVTNRDGTGLYFEILRRIYEPSKIKISFRILPWIRAKKMMQNRKFDVMLIGYYASKTDDLFPRYPIDSEPIGVIYRKGIIDKWLGQKSIEGKKVVWLRGYGFSHYLDVDVILNEVNKQEQGWELVKIKRGDFFIHPFSDLRIYVNTHKSDMDMMEMRVIFEKNLYLRFANTEKSKRLIAIYDQGIQELLKTGELKTIFDKWHMYFGSLKPRE